MKEIKLSHRGKNKGKYITLVDDEDFDYLNQFKWHAEKKGNTFYVIRTFHIKGSNHSTGVVKMHRAIMNTPAGMDCDHAFHDGLDNRRFIEVNGEMKANLRNCTKSQNHMNKRGYSKSGFIGVTKVPSGNYQAMVSITGCHYYTGTYPSAIEAAIARDTKAKELHGEFATLNFI